MESIETIFNKLDKHGISVKNEEWLNHLNDILWLKAMILKLNQRVEESLQVLSKKLHGKYLEDHAKELIEKDSLKEAKKAVQKMAMLMGDDDPDVVFCETLIVQLEELQNRSSAL